MGAAALMQQKLEKSPELRADKDKVKIDITEEGLRIQILDKADRVSFTSGSAELAQEARDILGEIARGICNLPNPIFVGGHTDRKLFPEGSIYTNWELSTDRANAARRTLEANCVKPEQIRRVVGYSDTELLIPSDPYAPANRRITIIVRRLASDAAPRPVSIKPDSPKIESGASGVPSPSPASAAQQANKTKLATEGQVSVGEPDKLPDGAKRTRAN
jgi:chemotaxis protein MotB